MTPQRLPDPDGNQYDHQVNNASDGGSIYANQGGNQSINHTYNTINKGRRIRTGWAVLAIIVLDMAFFFYGMTAYTGQPDNSGDLWRAGIFLVLLATTGSLIRRWVRMRL
jgi:hypothetical protein